MFLIRESGGDYVLSMACDGKVFHYKIQKAPGGYHFYGLDFKDMTELVGHHMVHTGKLLCVLTTSPPR